MKCLENACNYLTNNVIGTQTLLTVLMILADSTLHIKLRLRSALIIGTLPNLRSFIVEKKHLINLIFLSRKKDLAFRTDNYLVGYPVGIR